MKKLLPFFLLALVVASCSKDDGPDPIIDLGYNYFPVEIGRYVEYQVDSIAYDSEGDHDTSRYYVREIIDSEILDAQDEPSLRIVRFKKDSLNHAWEHADVWSAKRTPSNAQRIEEDKRFVRLVFPVSPSATWDGNALNSEDAWDYHYSNIGQAASYDDLSFSKTIRVDQRDYKNLIEDEYAYEIYADEVGLIEKYYRVLETNTNYINYPIGENIKGGVEYHFKIVDYGKEE